MAGFNYAKHDGLGLAKLVRQKEVKPIELVDAAIERIERHNPALNAVIWTMFDRAREMARKKLPDGPFRGVPFLLKDSLGDLAGAPTRQGSAFEPATPRSRNATLTDRYLAAGLIPLGKTNVPEFALMTTTESRLYGPARNPWNPAHSTGGSSGGSAAAVASGMVPMAHANDGGGSIRVPASSCGLVGLKPTRARTSIGPALGEGWGGLEVEHIVSRSVRDTAAMLDATAGPALGDPYWAPPQPKSYLASSRTAPKKLRIAQILTRADGTDLHPDCLAAVEHAGKICQGLGHRIDVVDPVKAWQMDAGRFQAFAQSYFALYATQLVTQIDDIIAQTRARPSPKKLEDYTLALYEAGKAVTGVQYQQALNYMHAIGRDMALWHQTYDVAIMPTLGTPPLKLGVIDPLSADIAATFGKMVELSPFAAMQNSTGQPAISLPLYESADGLPIGVQFVGRMGDEELLLKLARSIEKAAPWKDRHPSIWD